LDSLSVSHDYTSHGAAEAGASLAGRRRQVAMPPAAATAAVAAMPTATTSRTATSTSL